MADRERVGERVTIYRRGGTWHASFQVRKRQVRKALGTANVKEARRRAARIDVELAGGIWKPAAEAITVREATVRYADVLRTGGRLPSTMRTYTRWMTAIADLAEELGIGDVGGLGPSFLDAYRKRRVEAGNGPVTVYHGDVFLRQLVLFAVRRDLVARDPLKDVRLPRPKAAPQPCWTRAETEAILAAAPPELRLPLTLLAELGLRFGELAWLLWDDVDFAANFILIRPKPGWSPKTGDRRAVPMRPALRALLEGAARPSKWVAPMPPSRRHPGADRQWSEKRLLDALKVVLAKLGLPGKLHTFRHAFISYALLSGTAPVVVRKWAGHVDPRVMELYTHVYDSASQEAMRKLARTDAAENNAQ